MEIKQLRDPKSRIWIGNIKYALKYLLFFKGKFPSSIHWKDLETMTNLVGREQPYSPDYNLEILFLKGTKASWRNGWFKVCDRKYTRWDRPKSKEVIKDCWESCQKDWRAEEDSGLPLAKETIWASVGYNNLNGIKDIKNIKKKNTWKYSLIMRRC